MDLYKMVYYKRQKIFGLRLGRLNKINCAKCPERSLISAVISLIVIACLLQTRLCQQIFRFKSDGIHCRDNGNEFMQKLIYLFIYSIMPCVLPWLRLLRFDEVICTRFDRNWSLKHSFIEIRSQRLFIIYLKAYIIAGTDFYFGINHLFGLLREKQIVSLFNS